MDKEEEGARRNWQQLQALHFFLRQKTPHVAFAQPIAEAYRGKTSNLI